MIWSIILPEFAFLSILFFYFKFRKSPEKYATFSLNKKTYSSIITRNEVMHTVWSMFIFALLGGVIDICAANDLTSLYTDNEQYGYTYTFLSFFIVIGLNDIYFYLGHRFLHWKPIFKKIHSIHHQSHTPNPFSAFSFHPLEAVIQIGIIPLVAIFIPLHTGVLLIFSAFLLFMSVYGHCGYELRGGKAKSLHIFTNSIHHNQHHRYVNHNFGLFLIIWDKLFGTLHPKHKQESEAFQKGG
ncbi:sterol desaturase family protein [Bacteroidia bacterium]|nr:sterol desaturase family protein [Bacteroidia bacterium]MDB4107276.1 sterol desaturase family protein [Bacteroidia bacterium]MDB9882408.1 sterol desaturase family protein [Bacteroidia bacterium]MDC1395345.1 sterol desaturase family protein [Bacteroidia bacterium]